MAVRRSLASVTTRWSIVAAYYHRTTCDTMAGGSMNARIRIDLRHQGSRFARRRQTTDGVERDARDPNHRTVLSQARQRHHAGRRLFLSYDLAWSHRYNGAQTPPSTHQLDL